MTIELDFVKQLTTTKTNLTNKKNIKKSYNILIDSQFLFGKHRPEYEKLEDKIRLKFSYLCLLKILEDNSDDYEMDKEELREKSRQIYDSAQSYQNVLREKNKNKCKYINPYQNLLLGNSSSKIEIIRGYERQLSVINKIFDIELTKKEIDPRQIIETYSTFLLQLQSFKILMDPIEKRKIDEEILLNFEPNQENLYQEARIGDLSYIPEEDENTYKMENRFKDEIIFQKIGTLRYGFSFKDNSTLQNYRLKKKYISMENDLENPEKEYNIFTNLNISKLTSDADFTSLHADILFSDLNLQEAEEHNGGYIGEIIQNDNGKLEVFHYQDKLCVCKDYKKYMRYKND